MAQSLFDLTGRLALVTGSSRGLGYGFARGLADAGAQVILHGRGGSELDAACETLAAEVGRPVPQVTFDVTDAHAVQDAISGLIAEHGVPDILVNNAGIQRRAPFNEFTIEDWDAVIASNLSSAFYVSRAVSPAMSERGSGKIINIASIQSLLAQADDRAVLGLQGRARTADQGDGGGPGPVRHPGQRHLARLLPHAH